MQMRELHPCVGSDSADIEYLSKLGQFYTFQYLPTEILFIL